VQTLRHQLVPAALPQHTSRLLRLLLGRLGSWPAAGQLELVAAVKALVFEAAVGALFGERFLADPQQQGKQGEQQQRKQQQQHGKGNTAGSGAAAASSSSSRAAQLQDTFFVFEEGFELAASPLPHILQPRFLAARRRLLAELRWVKGRVG